MSCFPCLLCPLSSSLFGVGISLTGASKCLQGEGQRVEKCASEARSTLTLIIFKKSRQSVIKEKQSTCNLNMCIWHIQFNFTLFYSDNSFCYLQLVVCSYYFINPCSVFWCSLAPFKSLATQWTIENTYYKIFLCCELHFCF